ncbi:MAG: hypothetical protein JWM89_1903 [Acidimicrobiales bacterium]|nr:hypothetical protein [Acidimicrobiales bacterium]
MRRRVTAGILAVAVLAVVLFGLPLVVVVQRFVDEQAALRLERRAVLASRQVPSDFASSADPVELPAGAGIALALYDARGNRVTGAGPRRADAAVKGALENQVRQVEHGETRVAAIPVLDHETVIGVVRASEPTTVADRRAQRATLLLAALGLGVIVVGAAVARVVAGRLVRPVRQLRDHAVQLGDGNFGIETRPTGIAEVDDAGAALAATARQLDDLLQRERAFSADASHQLRTPLAALRSNIETELRFPRPDPTIVLDEALEDIARLDATIDQLLDLARTSSVEPARIELGPMLDALRRDWNGVLARSGRPLVVIGPANVWVLGRAEPLLRQALDALMDNAVRHGQGEVRVSVRLTGDSATVRITDHGPGFAPSADQPEADAGAVGEAEPHGFGLPLARRLVGANHGRLVIVDRGPQPTIDIVLRRAPVVPGLAAR